ncbi:Oxidoreductase OXR1 [Paramyrothecium foliicola]|nr:Oxidoreductase OXR1 [Paramyrothecium foliicola]
MKRDVSVTPKSYLSAQRQSTFIMGSLPVSEPVVKLLIAGGCYAGLSTALNLNDLLDGLTTRMTWDASVHPGRVQASVQITIVDERDGFFHVIGSPLALADAEYAKKAWVKFQDIPALQKPNITILQGTVASVDCANKTATIVDGVTKESSTQSYDYFVAASGLRRVWPVVPQSLTRKQYLLEAEAQIDAVHSAKDGVLVVGGGAVGIEMAAELKLVKPDLNVFLAHSRDKLLSSEGLSDECKDVALDLLKEAGVNVLMEHRLAKTEKVATTDGSTKYEVEFTNGHKMVTNEVVMAISRSIPSTTYLPASALDEEGYVKILPTLNFADGTPNASSHYCGGDAAKWSGIKRCGGAMHQGHYIAHNIYQSIMRDTLTHEPTFKQITEVPPMIGLAVGKKAVAYGPEVGTTFGTDVMQTYFRDDLGFDIVWEYMQLGGRKTVTA